MVEISQTDIIQAILFENTTFTMAPTNRNSYTFETKLEAIQVWAKILFENTTFTMASTKRNSYSFET